MSETTQWLSAEDIAKEVKVSAMTIKRNCQTYRDFINVKQGEKNKYLIDSSCVPVFVFIAKMRSKRNLQSNEIVQQLEKEGFPKIFDVDTLNVSKQSSEQSPSHQGFMDLDEIEEIISKRVEEELEKHELFLNEWTKKQEKQQQEFQRLLVQKLDNRDQKLLHSIREIQESKIELATSLEEPKSIPTKKWWEFWKH